MNLASIDNEDDNSLQYWISCGSHVIPHQSSTLFGAQSPDRDQLWAESNPIALQDATRSLEIGRCCRQQSIDNSRLKATSWILSTQS